MNNKSRTPLSTPPEINQYYQHRTVVQKYITKRFSEPLNRIEHIRQVASINHALATLRPRKVLEIAPGPARITTDLNIKEGTSIESSAEMIRVAQERMRQKGKPWKFIHHDFFTFSSTQKYDFVFCTRFLLHFKSNDRTRIYRKVHSLLTSQGYFMFEAMNHDVIAPLRTLMGKKRYFVYDKLYTRQELCEELKQHGFEIVRLYPVLTHFWIQAVLSRPFKILRMNKTAKNIITQFEKYSSKNSYEWMVLCHKV